METPVGKGEEYAINIPNDFVEKNWPLTEVHIEDVATQGLGGHIALVHSKEGKYVCKTAGSWKTPKALERDLETFTFLDSIKFKHVPNFLKTRTGTTFVKTESGSCYMLEYVEGNNPAFSPETYGKLGEVVGDLHNIKDFPFATDLDPSVIILDLIKNAEAYDFRKEYREVLKTLPNFQPLSQAPLHSDVSLRNTIEEADGNLVLIDWDDVGIGPAVLDIGAPLINQFITEDLQLQEESLVAFYRNYFAVHELPAAELPFIFDAGLFWACMYIRFGDTKKRWKRIKWAIQNKQRLIDLYSSGFSKPEQKLV